MSNWNFKKLLRWWLTDTTFSFFICNFTNETMANQGSNLTISNRIITLVFIFQLNKKMDLWILIDLFKHFFNVCVRACEHVCVTGFAYEIDKNNIILLRHSHSHSQNKNFLTLQMLFHLGNKSSRGPIPDWGTYPYPLLKWRTDLGMLVVLSNISSVTCITVWMISNDVLMTVEHCM